MTHLLVELWQSRRLEFIMYMKKKNLTFHPHRESLAPMDMVLNDLMARLQVFLDLGNLEYPFIAIAPRFTLTRSGSTWSMGHIELFDI